MKKIITLLIFILLTSAQMQTLKTILNRSSSSDDFDNTIIYITSIGEKIENE